MTVAGLMIAGPTAILRITTGITGGTLTLCISIILTGAASGLCISAVVTNSILGFLPGSGRDQAMLIISDQILTACFQ